MARRGIRRQVQRASSGSTPHDRVTILQICSSRSLALDRPRQSALRYPAVLSNRANTYSVRRQPAPIHAPLRSRTTSAIAPPTISHSARGTQIPITHAAPPTYPFPRFPPLEVCGRRPPYAPRHYHGTGIRKPTQTRKWPCFHATSALPPRTDISRVLRRRWPVSRYHSSAPPPSWCCGGSRALSTIVRRSGLAKRDRCHVEV